MRIAGASLLVALLFSAACNDSFPVPPNIPASPSTITLTATKNAPLFSMFRDGPGAQWTALTGTGTVNGPYEVVVVCSKNAGNTLLVWEHADVPNAKHPETTTVSPPCDDDPATFKLTGTLAVPGTVSVGTGVEVPVDTAGGPFSFDVPAGTYDIVVHTATSVSIANKAVTVTNANVSADPITFGTPLTLQSQTFTAKTDVDNGETGTVDVLLATPNSPLPSRIFTNGAG